MARRMDVNASCFSTKLNFAVLKVLYCYML